MKEFANKFRQLIDGEQSDAEAISFLNGLADGGESTDHIIVAVEILRSRANPAGPFPQAIDVCGTGGDSSGSVNVSTATALVAAACGVQVAKHGNRAASSQSGSSDVLAALGVGVQSNAAEAADHMDRFGITFLSAPAFHPVLARLAPLRRQIGRRTIFNLLGPLLNPAGIKRQLLGVYSPALLQTYATVLRRLGSESAWVVHGDGMDELTVTGLSLSIVLSSGSLRSASVDPQALGLRLWPVSDLRGGSPEDNAQALESMLAGAHGAYRDIVALNTAAALVVGRKADDLATGLIAAQHSIDSGAALDLLRRLRHKPA